MKKNCRKYVHFYAVIDKDPWIAIFRSRNNEVENTPEKYIKLLNLFQCCLQVF